MSHGTSVAITRRSAITGLAAASVMLSAPSIARGAAPRIVTVGGGVTETVFALGRGRDVVATDAASLYPHAAAALPKISYPKALGEEELLALRPDTVLAADEAGPQSALDAAGKAGARVLRLPEAERIGDIAAGVRLVAEAIGERARGAALADALAEDLALVEAGMKGVGTRRRALALLGSPDAHMLITGGRGSSAGIALRFAGALNAAENMSGWGWIAPSAASELDPEVVVALWGAVSASPERVLAAPGVRDTTAGREKRVATVDSLAFTGFGPRAAHAIHAVASQIYPEARFAAPPPRAWTAVEVTAL